MSDVNSVLDQVLEYFIPSKATPLNGIVIEPNLLDRVKIPPYKEVRTYGNGTRKTTNAPGSLTGSKSDYGATFTGTQTIQTTNSVLRGVYPTYELQSENWYVDKLISQSRVIRKRVHIETTKQTLGNYLQYDRQHEDWYNTKLISESIKKSAPSAIHISDTSTAQFLTYNTRHENWRTTRNIIDSGSLTRPIAIDTGMGQLNKFMFNSTNNGSPGAEPYYRLYPRKLFDYEITKTRPGGVTSINPDGVYAISPSTDFSDVGVYTFFNSPSGIYYFRTTTKTPAYSRPIDFEAATTWSYGSEYTINDVVYQNVTAADTSLGDLNVSARGGNNKYYVFKTRPSYTANQDGTYFYLNSVPSYIPPSLDKANWEPLRFTSIQSPLPRRIVFDTFTIPDPSLNNFNVTTISVDKIIDIPTRYIDSFTLSTVLENSYIVGELAIQNIAALFALQTNVNNIRLRLYRTLATRDADISRDINTLPTGSHGVLLDTIISTTDTATVVNPVATLVAGQQPPLGKLYYTIDNFNSTSTGTINLLLYYFAIQVEPRVPYGYLRKHYRFYRDNSVGIKRRNYVGCKNTTTTTIDGLPPVQIFISEGSDISVVATQVNNEIVTGGGGTLNSA
jgi:hypothetical protein